MQFRVHEAGQTREVEIEPREVIIAGMTGRDVAKVQEHIDELAELGVAPPSTIPIYYRVSASLLTQAPRIQAVGADSSGEVEAVLIGTPEGMLVTVGSDHTDRKVEAQSIALSKQLCPKPISRDAWRFADVAPVWDELELIADCATGGIWSPYQRGGLAAVRRPEDLIGSFFNGLTELPAGVVMFTGTIPVEGEIRAADQLTIGLSDPRNGRALWHSYDTVTLPEVS